MELVLTDGTVLDALARENKTLWQKIKDRIFEIIEKIKRAYGDLSKTSRTAQILSETMDSLDDIEQLFYEGVTEAGERTRTAGVENTLEDNGEVIYSVSPNLANELDLVLSGKFKADKNEVYLGETSNFLTDVIGAKALAHYMPASKAYSAMVTREEYEAIPTMPSRSTITDWEKRILWKSLKSLKLRSLRSPLLLMKKGTRGGTVLFL